MSVVLELGKGLVEVELLEKTLYSLCELLTYELKDGIDLVV